MRDAATGEGTGAQRQGYSWAELNATPGRQAALQLGADRPLREPVRGPTQKGRRSRTSTPATHATGPDRATGRHVSARGGQLGGGEKTFPLAAHETVVDLAAGSESLAPTNIASDGPANEGSWRPS